MSKKAGGSKLSATVIDPIKMLVYSPPGHGKTTFLGTAAGDPRLSPMLLLEFEGGTRSIASKIRKIDLNDLGKIAPELDLIHSISIRDWSEFNIVYDRLAHDNLGYVSLGVDSLSEINYLNQMLAMEVALQADRKHDPDILEQRDYLRSSSQMRKLVRYFRDLPMHVFLTASAQLVQDPRTKEMKLAPALTGKLVFEIPGLLEIVGYLALVDAEEEENQRWLFVQPTGRFEAKDRSEGGKLGEYITNPTLPKIMDLLEV